MMKRLNFQTEGGDHDFAVFFNTSEISEEDVKYEIYAIMNGQMVDERVLIVKAEKADEVAAMIRGMY